MCRIPDSPPTFPAEGPYILLFVACYWRLNLLIVSKRFLASPLVEHDYPKKVPDVKIISLEIPRLFMYIAPSDVLRSPDSNWSVNLWGSPATITLPRNFWFSHSVWYLPAIRVGVEPTSGDSVRYRISLTSLVNRLYLAYFLIHTFETRRYVCQFRHLINLSLLAGKVIVEVINVCLKLLLLCRLSRAPG